MPEAGRSAAIPAPVGGDECLGCRVAVEFDVEEGHSVATALVFARGDEFSPPVGHTDGNDADCLSDGAAGAWKGGIVVEGGLEGGECSSSL